MSMPWPDYLRFAYRALISYKARTVLIMMAMSLGVASVIALTAHTAPELVAEFLGAGMSGHLGKPFRQDTLRSLMLQHLCLA